MGFPTSRLSVSARSSACSSMSRARAWRTDARFAGSSAAHPGCAARAVATAASTSAADPSAQSASSSPVAGSRTGNVAPSAAATRSPPIMLPSTAPIAPVALRITMRDTVPHAWTSVKAAREIAVSRGPSLRDRLAAGETLVGTFAKLAGADPAEVLAGAGFDFAIVDREHSQLSDEDARASVRAMRAAGLPALVRVPALDRGEVNRLLEAGAAGIQLSTVRSAAQTRGLSQA